MDTVVLIPAYKPNKLLLNTVRELSKQNFDILVVNDGSPEEYSYLFDKVSEYATVVSYPINLGKGAALKYGMKQINTLFADCRYLITADADGQHSTDDICAIRNELRKDHGFILGVRRLNRSSPFLSRLGNALSRFIFTIASSYYLSDNQTGLRGFSAEHTEWMSRIKGDWYDYEMNVLMYAVKKRIKIHTLPITTIYIDNNSSSHFNPFVDTFRIHKRIFISAAASLAAFATCLTLMLCLDIVHGWDWLWPYKVSYICALSTVISWAMNKFIRYRGFGYRASRRLFITAGIRILMYVLVMFVLHTLTPITLFWSFCFTVVAVMIAEYYFRRITDMM